MDSKLAAEVLREHGTWHCDISPLKTATDLGAQALEAWAWVARTGHAPEGYGQDWQAYGANGYGEGPTPLAAVLDAMEKEGKG
jgi:hypothetical protein